MILASDLQGALGKENDLLFHFPKDLKRFKELTSESTVVMGRLTWESLPFKLPKRKNVVLTSSIESVSSKKIPDSFISSTKDIINMSKDEDIWVIGGARLYEEMIGIADEVELTLVHSIAKEFDASIEDLISKLSLKYNLVSTKVERDVDKISGDTIPLSFMTYKLRK